MIDAIDTDMHARPGDAELIPWLLVLDFAPQHVAKEFRSIMHDTRPHIKLCYVQRNFTGYTQPLERACMRAFKSSIRHEVAKHFAEFFLEVKSNFERVDLDSSTAVLRQLLLSFVRTAAQNVDSPQHRTAGWRFIDWNEVEERRRLAAATLRERPVHLRLDEVALPALHLELLLPPTDLGREMGQKEAQTHTHEATMWLLQWLSKQSQWLCDS